MQRRCLALVNILRSKRSTTLAVLTSDVTEQRKERKRRPKSHRPRSGASDRPQNPVRESARALAVQQLLRIEEEGAFVGRVAGKQRSNAAAQKQAAAIPAARARAVTEMVAQVTRNLRLLDWQLEQLTRRKASQLDPAMLQILRLAFYELFQAGMPMHVISEYVDLAKELVGPWSTSFANGVLRSATRAFQVGDEILPPMPSPSTAPKHVADMLGVAFSHPTWMVQRWLERFGQQGTIELLKANNRRPAHGVRANTLRGVDAARLAEGLQEAEVVSRQSTLLPNEFVQLDTGLQQLIGAGFLEGGSCMVQDESAGLVVAMLDPQPGERVLDACAAPGGKTLFCAARMNNQGMLLALDPNAKRLKALAGAARRCNVGPMLHIAATSLQDFVRGPATRSDSGSSAALGSGQPGNNDERSKSGSTASTSDVLEGQSSEEWGLFDRVLVDVPCSGLGVLAKRADLRWRRQPADLEQLKRLQAELLNAAARLVKPGGLLVYSTCSIEPEENAAQVLPFDHSHSEFSIERAPEGLLPPEVVSPEGFMATLPHVHGIDGAFAARLRRT